jgi:hypothetical protein
MRSARQSAWAGASPASTLFVDGVIYEALLTPAAFTHSGSLSDRRLANGSEGPDLSFSISTGAPTFAGRLSALRNLVFIYWNISVDPFSNWMIEERKNLEFR